MNFKRAFLITTAAMLLPGLAFAQATARFETTLYFSDGNDVDEVNVAKLCNDGVELNQVSSLGDGDTVTFISQELDATTYNCTITAGTLAGYTARYDETEESSSPPSDHARDYGHADPCSFDEPTDDNYCTILMVPDRATLTVSKVWDVSDTQATNIDYKTIIWVSADWSVLKGVKNGADGGHTVVSCPFDDSLACIKLTFKTKTPASQDVYLDIEDYSNGEDVFLREKQNQSSVEVTNTCQFNQNGKRGGILGVDGAEEVSCVFTNTAFFEGIPTLSQYGLAIMALLMLGVGFVGFRRFV